MGLLPRVCVAVTSLVFLLAGLSKLLKPGPFVLSLREYKLLPSQFLPLVAIVIPLAELSLSAAIIFRGSNYFVAALAALLMLLFAGAMATNLLKGRAHVPCGCGLMLGGGVVSWPLVFRNVAFAGIAFGGTARGVGIAGAAVFLGLTGAILSAKFIASPSPSHEPS